MSNTIFVRPTTQARPQLIMAFVMNGEPAGDGERVVIFERHPDHPHPGEIFITTASGATEVARTARIADLLANGVLEVVDAGRQK